MPQALENEEQESLVSEVLISKQQDPNADASVLANQIDLLIYKLYDLTYEEVKIVDPEFAMSEAEYEAFQLPEKVTKGE